LSNLQIFPEPGNSNTWKAAQGYVQVGEDHVAETHV
jgi:hypothetical protein